MTRLQLWRQFCWTHLLVPGLSVVITLNMAQMDLQLLNGSC